MSCEMGVCVICGAKTHTVCGTCGAKKLTDQYTEVEVAWTNGSKMKIGVCVPCATKNAHGTAHGKHAITQAHHDYWEKHGGTFDKGVVIA